MEESCRPIERTAECAANLCDTLRPDVAKLSSDEARDTIEQSLSAVRAQSGRRVSRLYVGSYFCDRYFCALGARGVARVASFARDARLSLTLVVPIFGQQTLGRGEAIVRSCVESLARYDGSLDEVCVNDYGEASFVSGLFDEPEGPSSVRLSFGRLFARALRDPRYTSFSSKTQQAPYDRVRAEALAGEFGVSLLELDPFAPRISLEALDGTLPIALHLPHSYVTTGHICEFASLYRPVSHKFRAESACDCPCLKTLSVYETRNDEGGPLYFSKEGRTVYFENPNCELDDPSAVERIIWTPDDFGCSHEVAWNPQQAPWVESGLKWE